MLRETVRREEVAAAAGVSVCTVSLVLRGMPGVSASTRARVEEAALRMGYQLNPVAALLAQRRQRARQELVRVACLARQPEDTAEPVGIYAGEGLELVWRDPLAFATAAEASRRLWHEGIEGLVVNFSRWPWPDPPAAFDWGRFSAVKLGRLLPEVPLHIVRHSPFDYMEETMARVVQAGYRRIAVLLAPSGSQRDDDARWGALLNWREHKLPAGSSMRVLMLPARNLKQPSPETDAWLRAEPFDALLAYHWTFWYSLAAAGWRFPQDVALAAVLSSSKPPPGVPAISGCDIQESARQRRTASLLRRMTLHGERGFPAFVHEDVIEPVWIDGETLPSR